MATQPLNSAVPRIPPQSSEGVILSPPPMMLAIQRSPEDVLREAAVAAKALRDLVEAKPKKVVLNGKTFLQFEDWLTVARFYGVTVAARSTEYITRGRVQGYECHAEAILVSTGQVIGAAQAECLDDEPNWNTRPVYDWQNGRRVKVGEEKVPLFQLRSMAQTRAQAKALRNLLSWVVVLAGYAPTPAEEMDAATTTAAANSIVPQREYQPMHPDRVRKLCFSIANAANRAELLKHWLVAAKEAKDANDREALDGFTKAKDARKKELQ
ncbi:MAG: hypothetical protein ACRD20_20595 [Terriglobales bacterium]